MDSTQLIAIHQLPGVGWMTLKKIMDVQWAPGKPISSGLLAELSRLPNGKKAVESLQKLLSPEYVKRVQETLKSFGVWAITILDEQYPPLLKEIPQPPWVIYGKGDPSLLSSPCLAIVGTRKPTRYGMTATRILASGIAQRGWTVVSGMALGIDAIAHQVTLEQGGRTIAVLGAGVEEIYPRQNRRLYEKIVETGAVISEMPPGTPLHPGLFPIRNRIISGLSLGTIVVEAAKKSGSLITADYSMEQGREVFAVPGPITSEKSQGTLRLIQQGAKCVTSVEEIFEELPQVSVSPSPEQKSERLPEPEQEIWNLFTDEPIHISQIVEKLLERRNIGEIHQALFSLEVKGWIQRLPGSYFVRIEKLPS